MSGTAESMTFMLNPKTGVIEQIPRHPDVDETLARNIIKHFS